MAENQDRRFALIEMFKLYLDTAERVSDRRAQANAWMISVNGALCTLYGVLERGRAFVGGSDLTGGLWVILAAGVLICVAWASLVASYRQLNAAKFNVLQEIEKELEFPLFAREQALYRDTARLSLSRIERWIPWVFVGLYSIVGVSAFL